ncbi:hypothetical protein [Streptomyces sp. NPDC057702]|uniref:hypothetical protein n=1 Tax=unclassified Streptomyces TaxID=2593676 RepID=UPI003678ECF2
MDSSRSWPLADDQLYTAQPDLHGYVRKIPYHGVCHKIAHRDGVGKATAGGSASRLLPAA